MHAIFEKISLFALFRQTNPQKFTANRCKNADFGAVSAEKYCKIAVFREI